MCDGPKCFLRDSCFSEGRLKGSHQHFLQDNAASSLKTAVPLVDLACYNSYDHSCYFWVHACKCCFTCLVMQMQSADPNADVLRLQYHHNYRVEVT